MIHRRFEHLKRITSRAYTDPAHQYINSAYTASPKLGVKEQFAAAKPFPHYVIQDFLNPEFCRSVRDELDNEKWNEKDNDLYKFRQTRDLKSSKQSALSMLRKALFSNELRGYLSQVTEAELSDQVDMAGQIYSQGDHLLCHDDALEGRRIAFILYLVPPEWTKEDGGELQLFDVDSEGQPTIPVHHIIPQVAEIKTATLQRYSITGWFHGKSISRPPPYIEKPLPFLHLNSRDVFHDFVNPICLDEEIQNTIRAKFEDESTISLDEFIIESKFNELSAILKDPSLPWQCQGPANRRGYYNLGRFDNIDFQDMVASKIFWDLLEKLTSVTITGVYPVEYRKWEHGCYATANDLEYEMGEYRLDVLFDPSVNWNDEDGGYTVYMDNDDVLLTLYPGANRIHIVLRDLGCMPIVKYIPHTAPKSIRYDARVSFAIDSTEIEKQAEIEDDDQEIDDDSSGIQFFEEEDSPGDSTDE